jgi:nicotinamidase/pyrazinamidase
MKALILVDIQNDFMPGGALPSPNGNEIVPLVNELIHYPFDLVVASKDWHPASHGSFASNHGKNPGERINLAGADQILWPNHCVQGTWGSEFSPGWDTTQIDKIIYKGTDPNLDSYSVFFDNCHMKSTGLESYLRDKSVKNLFFAGLATEYCVKYSVLDALQLGFHTYVIIDACRGINLKSEDSHQALNKMTQAGAILLSIKNLLKLFNDEKRGQEL